ncbi:MAG: pyridoxamine 5'-phosphate oxidase [Nocardioidaceae bacterium]
MRDLSGLRQEYADRGLDEATLPTDPITLFGDWLDAATEAGLHEPNAMIVATATPHAVPSARMVLLKNVSPAGFVFYTNYESRKGGELAANPAVALLFPWHDLARQVRVEGRATRLPAEQSAGYFATRPRPSQLGAWASPQSRVVASRGVLDARYDEVTARFEGVDVPLPPTWGGYLVAPRLVEFWQGRPGRMHDRLRFARVAAEDGWTVERLAP